jgi:hypothetical protein
MMPCIIQDDENVVRLSHHAHMVGPAFSESFILPGPENGVGPENDVGSFFPEIGMTSSAVPGIAPG